METKSAPRLLPVFFAALLLVMGGLLIILPKERFSPMEKRVLEELPGISLEGGRFSRGMESYLGDHFPMRTRWVGLDARRRAVSGVMVTDDIWRLPDGALAEAPIAAEGALLAEHLRQLSDFAGRSGLPFALMAVPSAGAVSGQEGYYPYPDGALLARIAAEPPEHIGVIPLFEAFRAAGRPLYYRTDPHWNGEGVYAAYREAAPHLGFEPLPEGAFSVTRSPGFRGSAYARSGLWDVPPDTLELWDSGRRAALRFDRKAERHDSLFFTSHLREPDQYPVFLDGNHGLTEIRNLDNPDGPALLMLKDSFGNSLVPLLLPHFGRITVLDLRAYRGSILALAGEGGYDRILAVYSLKSLAADTNFAWLGMQ